MLLNEFVLQCICSPADRQGTGECEPVILGVSGNISHCLLFAAEKEAGFS